jgi:hypothetical protein
MNSALLAAGAVKLVISIGLGGLGVFTAYRVLARVLSGGAKLENNAAAGVLHASALLSLGLLARQSLSSFYDTLDLLLARGEILKALPKVFLLGTIHIGLALALGTVLLFLSVWLFNRLTPGVDEVAQVREGHLGPALVLGAILVTFALLAAPGLEALLNGLVPWPELPADMGVPHA